MTTSSDTRHLPLYARISVGLMMTIYTIHETELQVFSFKNVHYEPNRNRSFVEITADLFDRLSSLNLCIKSNRLQGVQIFGQTVFWMFKDEINIKPSMLGRQTSTMCVFYTVRI